MRKIFFFCLLAIFLSIPFFPTFAEQASLTLSPNSGTFKVGESFTLSVWINTGGNQIDTIRASLSFPSNLLEVDTVQLGSVFNLPAGGNYFDNDAGKIYWGGGVPGGTDQSALFATLNFKVKGEGSANILFLEDTKVISNGEDVSFVTLGGSYTLLAIEPTPEEKPKERVKEEVIIPGKKPIISPKKELEEKIEEEIEKKEEEKVEEKIKAKPGIPEFKFPPLKKQKEEIFIPTAAKAKSTFETIGDILKTRLFIRILEGIILLLVIIAAYLISRELRHRR